MAGGGGGTGGREGSMSGTRSARSRRYVCTLPCGMSSVESGGVMGGNRAFPAWSPGSATSSVWLLQRGMPRARDGALIRLQMATGWEAEQLPAKPRGISVESMRRMFISHPEEDGQGSREELPGGPAARGSREVTPCSRNSGEARAILPSSPPPKKAPHREHRRDAQRCLQYIVPCMKTYGLCIVDRFLGHRTAEKILQEVLALHVSDKFQDGALAGQKPGSSKAIRGDKILWVEGSEPGCENIGYLLKRMDKLIMYADGKLGHYKIRGRHKFDWAVDYRRKVGIRSLVKMPLGHIMRLDLEKIALDYIVPCLHNIGFCYLDNFLGELVGDCVLERVKQMHYDGELQDGQLAGRSNGISKRHLRGDQIKWIAGTEEGCEAINFLLSLTDRLVMYCGSRLGKYYVKERSKVRALKG
uniref:Uncharacterized protein n=1 Tax=Sphaerodactylus townsendi TaxID=933632 RepID=A0ACB8G5C6_9SAUR